MYWTTGGSTRTFFHLLGLFTCFHLLRGIPLPQRHRLGRIGDIDPTVFEDSPFHRPSCKRVSAPPPAVGITTLGLFDYSPVAACWLTLGCKNAEPGLVTADPKLGVLCGENMSQQLHQSPLCNQSFTKKNCLEQHLLTQSDDHNYKCNDCGNIFSQTVTLTDHPRTNSGGRPYKCDYCDSSFSQKGQLN
ncbi:uncharacterized protein LOC144110636 [Amblyomma americanum]